MKWDVETDVLVVGSGNGGLTTALCCYELGLKDVLVVEKGEHFGGTSAMSGGGIWVPNNHYAQAAGAEDSYEDARQYLSETIPAGVVPPEKLDVYLQAAPKMLRFLHDRTRVCYESLAGYPDYYMDKPGAREGHRTLEPKTLNISRLGKEWRKLHLAHPMMYVFYRLQMSQYEAWLVTGKHKGWRRRMMWLMLKDLLDIPWRLKSKQTRRITNGRAGIARLRLSMQDRNMPLWLETTFEELVTNEQGDVIGARLQKDGHTLFVRARHGVMLAAGGFEQNQAMREQYLPQPTDRKWSAGYKGNTGDGIKAAMKIGAATEQMDGAWWCTTLSEPETDYPWLSIIDKSMPGGIVVNAAGKRIANESQNYMAYQKAFFKAHSDENPCNPSWMIIDGRFRAEYMVGPLRTSKVRPDVALPKSYMESGFLTIGESLDDLAKKVGIDPAGLALTIENFNADARVGKDSEFNRGDSAYDRYYGDPNIKPNPCLAPLVEPPFYAVRMNPGDFGTHGGLATDIHAQVLKENGEPIKGLYATGNCAAAILPTYPGPGSTLGPAMTFGYLAAHHMASCDTQTGENNAVQSVKA